MPPTRRKHLHLINHPHLLQSTTTMDDGEKQSPPPPPSSSLRKPKHPKTKNKTKPLSKKQQAIVELKLSILSKTLRPLPFTPSPQTLASLSLHSPLLRSLRLYDFAHLPLPSKTLRPDLLSHLIAHYDPLNRRSLVLGHRISLSRADLARALSLPLPVKKSSSSDGGADFDLDQFGGADAVAAVLSEFISGAMVLLEDAAILPDEVVTAHRLVRERQPHKVDWAGLMWALVDREMAGLAEEGSDGTCYYASHLQCLLKFQKPKLFEGDTPPEVVMMEEDGDEVGDVAEEGEKGEEDMEVENDGDLQVEDFKGGEDLGRRQDENEELLTAKFPPLENLNSSDIMEPMEGNNDLSFGLEHSNDEELFGMESKGVSLDAGPGCSFSFGNEHKRAVEEMNAHVGDGFIDQQKRFRSEQPWEQTAAVQGFSGCREEVQQLMEKARMDLGGKEQAYMNARGQIEHLNGVLEQKDMIIGSLHKARMEELRKRQYEECRLDHDVRTLSSVLFGYRRALRDTQIAFAEYRNKFPLTDEPIAKDGGGVASEVEGPEHKKKFPLSDEPIAEDGGRVASEVEGFEHKKKFPLSDEPIAEDGGRVASDVDGATELRKSCSPKEVEMPHIFRAMMEDEYEMWCQKLNEFTTRVTELDAKLVKLHEEFKLLNERAVKAKHQNHG